MSLAKYTRLCDIMNAFSLLLASPVSVSHRFLDASAYRRDVSTLTDVHGLPDVEGVLF